MKLPRLGASLFVYLILISSSLKAQVPGVIIAHSPASSGQYIGSPSICILYNGDYLASHDFFGPKSTEHTSAVSQVYLSKNKGKSWVKISQIQGQFWSKLVEIRGKLYIMGTNKHHGNTIIRNSIDGGYTWSEPIDGQHGLLLEGEYHCAPMPFLEHRGRLWRAMEDAMGPIKKWGKRYGTFMMSMPIEADPMQASSWTKTNVLRYDSTYMDNHFGAWIEGNAVVDQQGQVWNILRVDNKSTMDEYAAMVKISEDGKESSFDTKTGFIGFPGGAKKFSIRYDAKTKKYWTISNIIPDEIKVKNLGKNPASFRNTLALCFSTDLKNWQVKQVIFQHPDEIKHGFQYVDWQFQGKHIVLACRTAYDDEEGGAHNNHDANYLTFYRIKRFRK
ncbi:sialidase family protein [Aquirufa nivalisilvae]